MKMSDYQPCLGTVKDLLDAALMISKRPRDTINDEYEGNIVGLEFKIVKLNEELYEEEEEECNYFDTEMLFYDECESPYLAGEEDEKKEEKEKEEEEQEEEEEEEEEENYFDTEMIYYDESPYFQR